MDPTTVRRLVEEQLAAEGSFDNMHGITASNLRAHLVEPFEALVDPDDLESAARVMWVVLQEHRSPYDGYVVVYDPATQDWGVAELSEDASARGVLIASSPTLAGALDGM